VASGPDATGHRQISAPARATQARQLTARSSSRLAIRPELLAPPDAPLDLVPASTGDPLNRGLLRGPQPMGSPG
jgi:hypothetical protein